MMTPQSSCNESECEKQILEFKKTQQSSNDEETQSILKLPSSDMEKDLEIDMQPKESDIIEKVITFTGSAEATLPVQEPSVVLTPLMEKKIRAASPVNMEGQTSHQVLQAGGGGVEESGRERLKRHRVEMAGQVWIPDMWGQESLLKDWIDCNSFDASLMNSNIMLARAALAQEGRRATSTRIRIENSC